VFPCENKSFKTKFPLRAYLTSMGQNDIVMTFGKEVYQGMFVCGIIGLIIASFSIEKGA
jgi:hypothetical protein